MLPASNAPIELADYKRSKMRGKLDVIRRVRNAALPFHQMWLDGQAHLQATQPVWEFLRELFGAYEARLPSVVSIYQFGEAWTLLVGKLAPAIVLRMDDPESYEEARLHFDPLALHEFVEAFAREDLKRMRELMAQELNPFERGLRQASA